MSDELKKLIKEFYEERERRTRNTHRQAKELQSLQKEIRITASTSTELSDEEKAQVSDIINITDEWWCND